MNSFCVIADSLCSRNNGASGVSIPGLLDSMIRDGGRFNFEVRNYAIPGLTWRTAHIPTENWLIGGDTTPVAATTMAGGTIIVCLGVNDRNNPNALQDALAFRASLPDTQIIWVRQNMTGYGNTIVTAEEQQRMDEVYSALGGAGFTLNFGKLYGLGYTYDQLHPTSSGKQWAAASIYMYLQQYFPITPISRNIAWLYAQSPEVQEQMRKAQT